MPPRARAALAASALVLALGSLSAADARPLGTTSASREDAPSPPLPAFPRLVGAVPSPRRLEDADDPAVDASRTPRTAGDASPASTPPSIPRVIHVLWKTEKLPAFAEAYVSGWIANHPAWRVRRWTDADMLAFVRERFPADEALWHKFPTGVFRADTFRYMLLSALGGVYVDLDMESLRPMDPLLANRRCLLGQEPAAHARLIAGVPRRACNAWMASEANHPFWDAVLDEIRNRARTIPMTKFNPPSVTGPEALQAALDRFPLGRDEDGRGCGVVDPPEALFPAVDKSAIAGMRAKCEGLTRGRGVNPDKAAGVGCPAPKFFIPGEEEEEEEGATSEEERSATKGILRGVTSEEERSATKGTRGVTSEEEQLATEGIRGVTSDGDLPSVEMNLVPTAVTRGAPAKRAPSAADVCCAMARDGWANPPRETLAKRGAVAVHHWVHTWLDGPDARVSNAWRRRNALGVEGGWDGGEEEAEEEEETREGPGEGG